MTRAAARVAAPFVTHPEDWRIVESGGGGPFVSRAVYDGGARGRLEWTSRRHRMGLGLRPLSDAVPAADAVPPDTAGAIRRMGWWIGLLFVIGSAWFALASLPAVASRLDPRAVGVTFVVGAAFFTSAAALQHLQTLRAARAVAPGAPANRPDARRMIAEPRRLDWWVTFVQLIGTVFFNVTTIAALNDTLDTPQQIARVWAPDAIGSACFLIASYLAILEVCHGAWCRSGGDIGRRIARINMLGSIFFGISAVTSFIVPETGEVVDAEATNTTTFLGAACFLAGAVLLMEESRARPGRRRRPTTA
jgi:hypothetical protein